MDTTQKPIGKEADPDSRTRRHTPGWLRLLLIPAFLVLAFIAFRVDRPWLTYTTMGLGLCVLGCWSWLTFRVPEKSADGLVGGTPKIIPGIPDQVSEHVKRLGQVRDGEGILAAIDDSWNENGSKGLVVTDRRLFSYRAGDLRLEVPFLSVESLFIRPMWYPGAGILGRGEIVGQGSVVVLRLKFKMTDGKSRHLRLSQFASDLHPFLSALLTKLGNRVEVGRTLPGI